MANRVARAVGGAAVLAGVLGGGIVAASADPTRGFPVSLSCDDGNSYDLVVSGNGEFTPGHDVDSNSILVPTGFGEFHGVLRDDEGNIVDEFVDPAVSKGQSGKNKGDLVECTFSFVEVSDGSDPEFPEGWTFSGEGSVIAFVTPSR